MSFDPVLGDSRLYEECARCEAKGNLVRGTINRAIKGLDEARLEQLIESLPADVRGYIRNPPLASSWFPMAKQMPIMKGLVNGPLRGDVSKFREIGAEVARDDLASVYKVLLKVLSTPSFLINRIGTVHDKYARGVVMKGETLSPGRAVVMFTEGVLPYFWCMYGVPGWIDAALDIYKVKNQKVKHTTCRHLGAAQCKWDISWDV